MPDGMSLIETEALAERARQAESASKDIGFRQFGETLVRLALAKFPSEKLLARKLKSLLLIHVLPNASAKALAFHKAQLAAAQTLAAASTFSNTPTAGGPTAVANLSTVEVDAVFRKHNPLLRQVFQIYARITPNFMTMTFNVSCDAQGLTVWCTHWLLSVEMIALTHSASSASAILLRFPFACPSGLPRLRARVRAASQVRHAA